MTNPDNVITSEVQIQQYPGFNFNGPIGEEAQSTVANEVKDKCSSSNCCDECNKACNCDCGGCYCGNCGGPQGGCGDCSCCDCGDGCNDCGGCRDGCNDCGSCCDCINADCGGCFECGGEICGGCCEIIAGLLSGCSS